MYDTPPVLFNVRGWPQSPPAVRGMTENDVHILYEPPRSESRLMESIRIGHRPHICVLDVIGVSFLTTSLPCFSD